MKNEVSQTDKDFLAQLRSNVSRFTKQIGKQYDGEGIVVLDIAPQIHEGAKPYFQKALVETMDIDPSSKATYIADLCQNNSTKIPGERFDVVVCTEVLEHVLNPFAAVVEITRLLKPGGIVAVSTPFNFRIHGPLPDCWRFTEHGLRELFNKYEITSLDQLDDPKRFLMPIHYTLIAKKP